MAVDVLTSHPDIEAARMWLLDVAGDTLTDAQRPDVRIPVERTFQGRAASTDTAVAAERSSVIPISLRGHVMGALEVVTSGNVALEADLFPVGTLLAQELVGSERYGDTFGRCRHAHQLSVGATIQYALLPLLNYRDETVEVVGRLEPAYEVAGDVYDYAVNPEGMHLAVFDAVGHDLRSTTLSALAMGAYRRSRRSGAPLQNITAEIDATIARFDERIDFVTGVVARLDVSRGQLHMCNAGHPDPLLVRGGEVHPLTAARRCRPFGLGTSGECVNTFEVGGNYLLVFFTDGLIEARDVARQEWGVDRLGQALIDLTTEGGRLDDLAKTILDTIVGHVGSQLSDDAAILLVRPTPP